MYSTAHKGSLRSFIYLCLIATLLLGLGAVASAQTATTAAKPDRGIGFNGSYSASNIDSVSLQNGNVNVSVPLASLPPIAGGKHSFTVSATYNSKIWDVVRFEERPFIEHSSFVTDGLQISNSGGWRIGGKYELVYIESRTEFDRIDNVNDPEYPILSTTNYFKTVIKSPDGATHELKPLGYSPYNGNHEFLYGYYSHTPITVGAAIPYYSFDGSYIWALVYPSGNVSWELFLNDGTHVVQRTNGTQRIYDSNENEIKIYSEPDPNNLSILVTHYVDALTGREIKQFRDSSGEHIQYQIADGSWVSVNVIWGETFVQGQTYHVPDQQSDGLACERKQLLNEFLPVVKEIVLPQTETGQTRRFTFKYNSDLTESAGQSWQLSCQSQPSPIALSSKGWGSLSELNMPSNETVPQSGVTIKYLYQSDTVHDIASANEAAREGILTKQIFHDGVTDSWNYSVGATVGTVNNPDGTTTTENFYSHDTGFSGTYGGMNGLGGLGYRIQRANTVIIERRWSLKEFAGSSTIAPGTNTRPPFNPVIDAEYTTLLAPDGVTKVKMSVTVFEHDYNGNMTKETDYDWFAPNLVNGCRDSFGVPTCVPASAVKLRIVNHSYYNAANDPGSLNVYAKRNPATGKPFILDAPQESSISDSTTQLSRTQFFYDNLVSPNKGNLTKESSWLKYGTENERWIDVTHTYDSYGNRTSTTAPSGVGTSTTTVGYDMATNAQPISIMVNPQNGTGTQTALTQYNYWTGLPISGTDVNNQTTTTSYVNQRTFVTDPYNRPGVVTAPAISSFVDGTTYSNQARKVITKYFDNALPNNAYQVEVLTDLQQAGDGKLRSRTTLDQLGRVVLGESSEDGSAYSISSHSVYEQMGRITYISNPQRVTGASTDGWIRTTRDNAGRVIEVATFSGRTQPPQSGTNANWTGSVTTSYNANSTTVTDQAGKVRRSVVDALGRLIRVDEPDLSSPTGNLGSIDSPIQATSYEYDALGNLKKVIQGGQIRTFKYDSLSRLKEAFTPEQVNSSNVQVATRYTYDDASNLTRKDNPNGSFLTFTYDGLNRATSKTLSSGNTWIYTFDTGVNNAKGRLVKVTKQGFTDGTYFDGYDNAGRIQSSRQITTAGGTAQPYTTSYAYDLAGNLTKEIYPSGKEYRRSYDSGGRIAGVSRYTGGPSSVFDKTYASGFQYTAHGAMSAISLGGTVASPMMNETRQFNSRLQVSQIEVRKQSGNTLLLGLDYAYGATTQNNSNISSQTIRLAGQANISQTYQYDSLNRLSTTTETGAWAQTYDYDRYGNRAVRNNASTPSYLPNPILTPQSAFAGDLSAFNATTNRIGLSGYTYDTSGNLKSDPTTAANAMLYDSENKQTSYTKAGITTTYTYDAYGRRVLKSDTTGTLLMVYDAMGQMIAEYRSDPVPPPQAGGGTSYLMSDSLSSTRVVADANGNVKSRRDYLPFGEEIPTTAPGVRASISGYGSNDGQRHQFTGQERDNESGMDYMGARYYSAAQGRFSSADTIGGNLIDPQTLNLYSYVHNNPLLFKDPTGHHSEKDEGDPKDREDHHVGRKYGLYQEAPRKSDYKKIDDVAKFNKANPKTPKSIVIFPAGLTNDTHAEVDNKLPDIAKLFGVKEDQVVGVTNGQTGPGGAMGGADALAGKFAANLIQYALDAGIKPENIMLVTHSNGVNTLANALGRIKASGFLSITLIAPQTKDVDVLSNILSRTNNGWVIQSDNDSILTYSPAHLKVDDIIRGLRVRAHVVRTFQSSHYLGEGYVPAMFDGSKQVTNTSGNHPSKPVWK